MVAPLGATLGALDGTIGSLGAAVLLGVQAANEKAMAVVAAIAASRRIIGSSFLIRGIWICSRNAPTVGSS